MRLTFLFSAFTLFVARTALAQETDPTPTPTPEETETVVPVIESRSTSPLRLGGGTTVVSQTALDRNPALPNLNSIIATNVPGAAALPNGAIRIRGSDNQFSYFLDGAPVPANVSAFITDQFNPRNIQSLRVLTGAFPALYGGQLSAIFDIRAKAGQPGAPTGYIQSEVGNFDTRTGALQLSGGSEKYGYFLSGLGLRTDFRLSPISSEALHNGGRENVGFGKFDYRLSERDSLIFHLGGQKARLEVPNSPDRDKVGQDNHQLEDKRFFNAIWKRDGKQQSWTLSLYNHTSQNRYQGSPGDLIPSEEEDDEEEGDDDDALISVNQRQRITYTGVRGEYFQQQSTNHRLGAGFELRQARGKLNFNLSSPPEAGFDPLVDQRNLHGSDYSVFVEDDWKRSGFNLNYGARYDVHRSQGDGTYSQLSPRINLSYEKNKDTFYGFYNRLWMPVPVESIRRFEGDTALGDLELSRVRPETDDYFGLGWKRSAGKATFTVNAYYKSIRNIVDNQEIGDTLLEIPINEARGKVRGIEFSYDRPLTRNLAFSSSYGLSRGTASGPINGGLLGLEDLPAGYFIDDHDLTHVATASLLYNKKGTYGLLIGQFESGLPFGENENADGELISINTRRSPSHFVLNGAVGHRFGSGLELALNVNNVLDNKYIIAADNVFRRSIYGQRRAISVKATFNF